MDPIAEKKVRSLSDLRSNLETGLYATPQTFDEKEGLTDLAMVDPQKRSLEGGLPDGAANNDFFVKQRAFSSSDKSVSSGRLH